MATHQGRERGSAVIGIAFYLFISMIFAISAFLASEWIRLPGAPAPDHPGGLAVVAGLLWPVLAIGLVQWALLAVVHRQIRLRVAPAVQIPDEVRV